MSDNPAGKSLKTRLVLRFSALVAILLVALTAVAALVMIRSLTSDLKSKHLLGEVNSNLRSMERRISHMAENLQQFARDPSVINSLIHLKGRADNLPDRVRDFHGHRKVVAMTIVDFEGNPIYSTLDSPPPYREKLNLRAALALGEEMVQISQDRKCILLVEPIAYYQTPQGAVIVESDLPMLLTQSLPAKPALSHRVFFAGSPLFEQNFDRQTGYIALRNSPDEKYPYLRRLGIELEVGALKSEYLAAVRTVVVQYLLLGGGFILLAIILAIRFGNSLARPIVQLCERVRQADISNDQRCSPVGTGDELEELATAFDARTGQLARSRQRLEDYARELRGTNVQLQLLASVFENTLEGIVILNAGENIERVNPAFCSITGFSAEEVRGSSDDILHVAGKNGEVSRLMWKELRQNGFWNGEIWCRRKNGEAFPAWHSVTAVRDGEGRVTHYVSVFHDISAIKSSEDRLEYQAYHDALTGLPNRQLFFDRLERALARARRRNHLVAVLFLDLDNFKHINDSLGHHLGDLYLREAARRLQDCCRETDTVARLGGDEFTVILGEIREAQEAICVARRFMRTFSEPVSLEEHQLYGSASIGITLFPKDGQNVETLVKNADMAMYRAKQEGKNNYQLFDETMNHQAVSRLTMETNLRKAVEEKQFQVHYQPKVCLATGAMIGMEALVRWFLPDGTLVSPAEFVPLAEETGLILPIEEQVLKTACRQARIWHDAGHPLAVAVNLSLCHFRQRGFVENLSAILQETGLDGQALELEITEGVVMENPAATAETLQKLRQMGIRLSIDDFGTGYSSLACLKHLPIDALKIDIDFIREIPQSRDDVAIASTIIAMADRLDLEVVAEGVETAEQLRFLREHGCHQMQGYLFSPPVTGEQILKYLEEGRQLDVDGWECVTGPENSIEPVGEGEHRPNLAE